MDISKALLAGNVELTAESVVFKEILKALRGADLAPYVSEQLILDAIKERDFVEWDVDNCGIVVWLAEEVSA
jgi:hypothetical protein